jgi:hypothetical protein
MDWTDPNLWFEGLGGAIVGGGVAAATALLVVRRTDQKNRALARELHAREEARALIRECHVLGRSVAPSVSNTPEEAYARRAAFMLWVSEMQGSIPTLTAVDGELDVVLQNHMTRLYDLLDALEEMGAWPSPGDDAEAEWLLSAKAANKRFTDEIVDLTTHLANWLSARK